MWPGKKDIQEKRGKFAKLLIDWLADATHSAILTARPKNKTKGNF